MIKETPKNEEEGLSARIELEKTKEQLKTARKKRGNILGRLKMAALYIGIPIVALLAEYNVAGAQHLESLEKEPGIGFSWEGGDKQILAGLRSGFYNIDKSPNISDVNRGQSHMSGEVKESSIQELEEENSIKFIYSQIATGGDKFSYQLELEDSLQLPGGTIYEYQLISTVKEKGGARTMSRVDATITLSDLRDGTYFIKTGGTDQYLNFSVE